MDRRTDVERAMMKEDRWVSKKAVREIAERQVREVATIVEREGQVEAKWRSTKEAVAWMKEERRSTTMKCLLKFSSILCPINFSLEFIFRLCKIDFPFKFSFRLNF